MRILAVAVALALLTGCGQTFEFGKSEGPILVRCPPELPERPECKACSEWERPKIESIEDQGAALDLAEAALIECRTLNSGCVRRDTTISFAWKGCPTTGD